MELKCLLMWLLFGSVKGNKPEECPALPRTKFADVTAETYPVGTRLHYECDNGYRRRGGQKPGIQCQSTQQVASWVYREFECIDFCGPPKTIPHASLILAKQYYVGQVLHFKCQSGYDKRFPTSGNRTCKKVNGKIIWTPLDMRCTNDSSSRDEWPDPSLSLWCPVQSVSGSTHPSFSSSVILPMTAVFLVLLIIPALFV
ncbi:interleukin-2 receptor subunit alpha-like isoform 2-T3 [Alca torda]